MFIFFGYLSLEWDFFLVNTSCAWWCFWLICSHAFYYIAAFHLYWCSSWLYWGHSNQCKISLWGLKLRIAHLLVLRFFLTCLSREIKLSFFNKWTLKIFEWLHLYFSQSTILFFVSPYWIYADFQIKRVIPPRHFFCFDFRQDILKWFLHKYINNK